METSYKNNQASTYNGFVAGNYYTVKAESYSPAKSDKKGYSCIDVIFTTEEGFQIKQRYYLDVYKQITFDLFNACSVQFENPNKPPFGAILGKKLTVKIGVNEWSKVVDSGEIISRRYYMFDLHTKVLDKAVIADLNAPVREYTTLATTYTPNEEVKAKTKSIRNFFSFLHN